MSTLPEKPSAPNVITFRSFGRFKQFFSTLYETFDTDVIQDQWNARRIRRLEVSVDGLQQSGKLAADETYIPVRIIDRNVNQKMPSRLGYLKSANRLAIFEADINLPDNPTPPNTARLESEFWRVLTYDGWETPYIAACDGCEFVGWNWLEVLYTPEPDRPGNVSINHIGRENLIFDMGVDDIQKSKVVVKRIPITLVTLREYADLFAFKPEFVAKLAELVNQQNTNTSGGDIYDDSNTTSVYLFRAFWKESGVVWTAFYGEDFPDWLNEPHEFYNGVDKEEDGPMEMQPGSMEPVASKVWAKQPETDYPFYPVVRKITEDRRIAMTQGSVSADYGTQEAACSIFSTYVNKAKRSGVTMWSPEGDAYDKSGAPKQIPLKFQDGQIWDRPMKSFSIDPPDSSLPNCLDQLETLNAENNQNIAWSVNNRKDSRKTATEVSEASRTQGEINSAETFMLSIALRSVWIGAWRIVQSQALQNLITFCPIAEGQNDIVLLSATYRLKAAGDTDFVERTLTVNNMLQDMELVMQTPAAMPFLIDFFRLRYPARGNVYIAALEQGMLAQQDQVAKQKDALLKMAVTDETGALTPEFKPFESQIQQLLSAPTSSTGQPVQPIQVGENKQQPQQKVA